jgi:uncharacterized membrane protein YjjP (DUF1212 family)
MDSMSDVIRDAYQKRVLILALFAGEIMLKSGAEVYRVEDTIIRICMACRVDYVECVATTTSIILSIDRDDEDADMHTFLKRIDFTNIHLTKISKINQFSRVFTSTDLSVEDGFEQLKAINCISPYPTFIRILAAALVGITMVPYYGGGILDMLCAGICGAVAYMISIFISVLKFPKFINIFVSSAVCAVLAYFLVRFGFGTNFQPVIIGAVTIFMPGIAITNAARDLLSGDMLSGVARAAEALIIAIAIAGGTGVMLRVWQKSMLDISNAPTQEYTLPLFLLFGFITTGAFALMFRAPLKLVIPTAVVGAIGMMSLVSLMRFGFSMIAASFLGTVIVAVLSEVLSRAGKDATTIFILPSIIPFVPGTTIMSTMSAILESDFERAAAYGSESLFTAGAIAVAIILVASITRIVTAVVRRSKARLERRRIRLAELAEIDKGEGLDSGTSPE